jgi:hypothetical protein
MATFQASPANGKNPPCKAENQYPADFYICQNN